MFYFNPDTPLDDIVLSVVEMITNLDTTKPSVLCGDYNCRIDSGDRGRHLKEIMQDMGFLLKNDCNEPTYIGHNGSSLIDLVFTTNGTTTSIDTSTPRVRHLPIRKHGQVHFQVTAETIRRKKDARETRVERKIDYETMATLTDDLKQRTSNANIQQSTDLITEVIQQSIRKNKRSYHKPWFDKECQQKKKEVMVMYRGRGLRNKAALEQLNLRKRSYKRLCCSKREAYENKLLMTKLREAERRPWMLLRGQRTNRAAQVATETLCEHFQALHDPQGPPQLPLHLVSAEGDIDEWYNRPFTVAEVESVILSTKDRKATGPDGIANEHMKQSLQHMLQEWADLFNKCLVQRKLPRQWTKSFTKVLYKGKGDPTMPDSYRGISLLCSPFKVLTALLNRRIIDKIDELLPDQQFGFRHGRSTHTPLREMLDRAATEKDKKKGGLYVLFVDFRAAFPSLDRATMVRKLKHEFGIDGNVLGLICEILKGATYRIDDGVNLSEELSHHKGVQQGDSLSPTLFICYVKDLTEKLNGISESMKHAFYADDLEVDSPNPEDIQKALDVIGEWSDDNDVAVNIAKTRVMKLRNGGRVPGRVKFSYKGADIQIVNEYEYLGMTVQPTLTFTKHVQKKQIKCAAATGSLKLLQMASLEVAMKIFRMKVRPIMEYGLKEISPQLTLPQLQEIDKVKTTFVKRALGVHKNASNTLTLMLAGEDSLVEELKGNMDLKEAHWEAYQEQRLRKIEMKIDQGFLLGPGFTCERWKKQKQKDRHFVMRMTVHGFHFKICMDKSYHDPRTGCICRHCSENIDQDRYHVLCCVAIDWHDVVF
jgi:hypothetical protein